MKVKICGITDLETALFAVQFGADAIGFVFADSKRRISPEMAKKIILQLPKKVLKVGVFVNEEVDAIQKIVNETGINVIQLHGDETPEFCTQFTNPVIKALSIKTAADLQQINHFSCEYFLLDSPRGKFHGGNGIAFDWSILNNVQLEEKRIILAGGLTSENIERAIELTGPHMVDVSSGVETNGKKDMAKIKGFIERVKRKKEEVL
ncbi:phosphoribosylanthranilate isomerase [Bacillus sp. FJAT-49705]|uniref:N-(5'-phosphoribosyl)anthranilate isomerase n=1 Tax=Cytobacillus citreus TaxID=2833586 RepID=A0ABS5P042_9BACI|nr:phosphoribosylanthranilate isomerase [Cytobacillus citreus]MBS4193019.1 phosphoribosylanthranilate isomerase [Cytobacillus citreus]